MSPDWRAGRALLEQGSLCVGLVVKGMGRRFPGDLQPKGLTSQWVCNILVCSIFRQ